MPSKTAPTPTRSSTDPSAQIASVATLNGATMEFFTQACQAYAVGMATLNNEVMSFVNARVNQDVELGQALCRCGKWRKNSLARHLSETGGDARPAVDSRLTNDGAAFLRSFVARVRRLC